MQPTNRYAVAEVKQAGEKARLLCDGKPIESTVDGRILEAQFELEDGCALLFLSDDSPYDEGLHVYLLSARGEILDCAEASAPFTPGLFRLEGVGKDWVQFRFYPNEISYRLRLLSGSWFRKPAPRGWRYKPAVAKRRFMIETMEGKL